MDERIDEMLKNVDYARDRKKKEIIAMAKAHEIITALAYKNGQYICRQELRGLISSRIGVNDPHIVNLWIDNLVSKTYLTADPRTINSETMRPKNSTKYLVNL